MGGVLAAGRARVEAVFAAAAGTAWVRAGRGRGSVVWGRGEAGPGVVEGCIGAVRVRETVGRGVGWRG